MPAGDPPGFSLWKSAELKGFAKTLAPKMNDKKVATQTIANYGNYSFMVAHREGSGEAEYHEKQADVFVVQSGEATLVVGGELVDAWVTRRRKGNLLMCGQRDDHESIEPGEGEDGQRQPDRERDADPPQPRQPPH